MSSYKRKFFVNTISNIMFRLLIMVLGIVLVPLIITNVGEEEYGLLLLTNNLMGYFLLLNAGMPTGVTKFVSEFMAKDEKMKAFEVINASMLFFMFIGLLSATGIVIFINVGGINIFEITEANVSTAVTLFYIAGFWSIISWPMNNIFEGIYKGLQQFTKFNVINGIGSTLVLFTTLFLAYRKESIVTILLGQNLGQLLKWIALFYFFKKSFPDFKFSFNRDIFSVLKKIFSFSSHVFLQKVIGMIGFQSDKMILSMVVSVKAVTAYIIVHKTNNLVNQIVTLSNSALMPLISELNSKQEDRIIDRLVFAATKYKNIVVISLAIVMVFVTPPFITMWVGENYIEFIFIAQVSAASLIFSHTRTNLPPYAIGIGKVKELSFASIANATVKFISAVLLVNLIGFDGIIYAEVIKGIISVFVAFFYLMPAIGVDTRRFIKEVVLKGDLRIVLFSLLFIPFYGLIQDISNWFLLVAVSGVMLLILLLLSYYFVVETNDRKKIQSTIKKKLKTA